MLEQDNLTDKQLGSDGKSQFAVFLPALSGFYATYVGKQQSDPNYVEASRIPAKFEHGVEGLNWLNKNKGYFTYKWSLYSAGHAELDINKIAPKEDMIRNRDRQNTFVLGDSGGFQIGKLLWEGDWKDVNCPKASLKRRQVLEWMDAYMDRGMILDVPVWAAKNPTAAKTIGIANFEDAVKATTINNEYFMRHRNGNCKFLNVLQGEHHSEADLWYDRMKHFCDPKKHDQPFEGWAMGGQNMSDVELILRRLVQLRHDGLLEKGRHDWIHFLGTSKLEWAVLLSDIQRAIRKYHNENLTISYDCASPFLATANGQVYTNTELTPGAKWSYRMKPSIDDKKYARDTRTLRDALLQDNIFEDDDDFEDSPISSRLLVNNICVYGIGDLNKLGKEGSTSWDSFSYALQMGHNVHRHIYAVQEANRRYDSGVRPEMMYATYFDKKQFRHYKDYQYFSEVVDAIFETSDKGKSDKLIQHFERYFRRIIGTRGNTGDKLVNPNTYFKEMFGDDGAPTEIKKEKKPITQPIFNNDLWSDSPAI
jgi:hypothetical protein